MDNSQVSDGYHTFGELYAHRISLYIALCKILATHKESGYPSVKIWRSKTHSDGAKWDGWFILGISTIPNTQITYHLPESDWSRTEFAQTLDKAPEWDGHTSADVLDRLKTMFG